MKQYYIIGNGGFAKEVLFLAETVLATSSNNFGGFIDYQPKREFIQIGRNSYKVFDEKRFLRDVPASDEVEVFLGLGNPLKAQKIVNKFKEYSFPNLIHPNVEIHKPSVEVGKGNIITAGCVFTVDITVGSFNVFNLNTTIGHDTIIGSCNTINPGVNISGSVVIGDTNLIGTNASILQGIRIGSRNRLGAASMVNKEVGDDLTMVGVPAKSLNKK